MKTTVLKYCRHICAILAVALLVLHFMPFWTVEEEAVSLCDYTWFTEDNKDTTKYIKNTFGDLEEVFGNKFAANNLGYAPILTFAFSIISLVIYYFGRKKGGSFIGDILFGVCGLGGVMFLSNPILQLGSTCTVHGILGGIMIFFAVGSFIYHVFDLGKIVEKTHP